MCNCCSEIWRSKSTSKHNRGILLPVRLNYVVSHHSSDTMLSSKSVSRHTALCRCAVYLKQHIGTVEGRRPVISKSTHFRCCTVLDQTCIMGRKVVMILVLHESMYFFAKRFLNFTPQRPWPLSWPKIMLCQLLLTCTMSPLTLNVVQFSVFELTVGIGQTDGRTHVVNCIMRSLEEGRIVLMMML